MPKIELTQDQIDFKLDPFTLNNNFIFWLEKSKCMWNLKETNNKYNELRESLDHATAMETLKRQMFQNSIK
ncbi:hypothetical protein [Flavobacterium phage FL-1]|nr:hypothetical protein [Flavobacterium phage FL-1]